VSTPTEPEPPAPPKLKIRPFVKLGGAQTADCVTTKGEPATISVAVRDAPVPFGETWKTALPLPVPLVAFENVIQEGVFETLQEQPVGIVTPIVRQPQLPPLAGRSGAPAAGDSVALGHPLACATVNTAPPTTIVADRAFNGFAEYAKLIVAGPVPLEAEVTLSQG
jgi:hypothetical protein